MKPVWHTLVVLLVSMGQAMADEPAKAKQGEKADAPSAAERLKANPDDLKAFRDFMNENVSKISSMSEKDPDGAEKELGELKTILDSLEPETPEGKASVTRGKNTANLLKEVVALARISLEDLEAKLDANPHDFATLAKYFRKVTPPIGSMARSDPEKADTLLRGAKARFEKGREGTADEAQKKQLDTFVRLLGSYERVIESSRKMLSLIGKDAAPLEVETWINGTSLADADLKGKVVLLDFWAVWCGPCIATFPHLREWQDKYADKGLVIIGLTKYYNFEWDETAKRAKRAETVTPEAEQEMLKQFAASHELRHRFAIQTKESKMPDYYGVTGIPHVVIIDQAGKIRMMRVGSGEQNAKDLAAELEKLLANNPAAGG